VQDKKILYILSGLVVVLLGAAATFGYLFFEAKDNLALANNVISASVDEIQEFDKKLGISKSNLRTEKDLNAKYSSELSSFDKEFKDMQKKHNLEIKSRDKTIVRLKGNAKGGNSKVTAIEKEDSKAEFTTIVEVTKEVCGNRAIGYEWHDDKERFVLKDPDIFKQGNEEFSYKQYFEIKGHVFTDKTGNVQIRKLELKEVHPSQDLEDDTVYSPIDNSNISLVSSKFEYTNKIGKGKHLFNIVTLRPIVTFDTSANPGIGIEIVNLGRYIDYFNLGIYAKTSFDISDLAGGSLQNSRIGIGIQYHLIPPLISTNFALGASISTPFNNLGTPILMLDIALYLTDDTNPFSWLK